MELTIENVSFSYNDGSTIRTIFSSISYTFIPGRFYIISGESGSGKTTLLSLLAGFEQPQSGKICYNGKDIASMPIAYRRRIMGFVFQNYNLIPYLNGIENIQVVFDISAKKASTNQILDLLKSVDIDPTVAKQRVTRCSGGEQQRIAIARAIARNPRILLADEPTGNLDFENSQKIIHIFERLAHQQHKCVIMVSHDPTIIQRGDIELRLDKANEGFKVYEHH